MMSFISSVQQMAAQLTDLQLPISELQVISKVLMSLPANYLHFVSAWDSVPAAEKTITLLISRLLKEEKMTNIRSQNKPNPSDAAYFSGTQEQSCMLYLSGFFFFLLFFKAVETTKESFAFLAKGLIPKDKSLFLPST